MSFWKSGSGAEITGKPEDCFIGEFDLIPNNTTAPAAIKDFELTYRQLPDGTELKFYQIIWKLMAGEFKGREVTQKIKCFNEAPEKIDRALNMLKLILDLCSYKPAHSNELKNQDLHPMIGKTLGIKIREWEMVGSDGKTRQGNFVSEVHPITNDFVTETGMKKPSKAYDSSFGHVQENVPHPADDESIPF